jgi:ketosteroid isomerase-like protein
MLKALGAVALAVAWALPVTAGDKMDAPGTAAAFATGLAAGDEATVKSLLAPDVLIYESGGQEASLAEYAAHHMKADMEFLTQAKSQVLDRKHDNSGDLAWVATRTRVTGTYKDKPLDLYSTETLVLKRGPGGWRIVHIQWSSRSAETKAP